MYRQKTLKRRVSASDNSENAGKKMFKLRKVEGGVEWCIPVGDGYIKDKEQGKTKKICDLYTNRNKVGWLWMLENGNQRYFVHEDDEWKHRERLRELISENINTPMEWNVLRFFTEDDYCVLHGWTRGDFDTADVAFAYRLRIFEQCGICKTYWSGKRRSWNGAMSTDLHGLHCYKIVGLVSSIHTIGPYSMSDEEVMVGGIGDDEHMMIEKCTNSFDEVVPRHRTYYKDSEDGEWMTFLRAKASLPLFIAQLEFDGFLVSVPKRGVHLVLKYLMTKSLDDFQDRCHYDHKGKEPNDFAQRQPHGECGIVNLVIPFTASPGTIASEQVSNPAGVDFVGIRVIEVDYELVLSQGDISPNITAGQIPLGNWGMDPSLARNFWYYVWIDKSPNPPQIALGFQNDSPTGQKICVASQQLTYYTNKVASGDYVFTFDGSKQKRTMRYLVTNSANYTGGDPYSSVSASSPLYVHCQTVTIGTLGPVNMWVLAKIRMYGSGTVATVSDVNVVGIGQLTAPVWTTNFDPEEPVIDFGAEEAEQAELNAKAHREHGNTDMRAKLLEAREKRKDQTTSLHNAGTTQAVIDAKTLDPFNIKNETFPIAETVFDVKQVVAERLGSHFIVNEDGTVTNVNEVEKDPLPITPPKENVVLRLVSERPRVSPSPARIVNSPEDTAPQDVIVKPAALGRPGIVSRSASRGRTRSRVDRIEANNQQIAHDTESRKRKIEAKLRSPSLQRSIDIAIENMESTEITDEERGSFVDMMFRTNRYMWLLYDDGDYLDGDDLEDHTDCAMEDLTLTVGERMDKMQPDLPAGKKFSNQPFGQQVQSVKNATQGGKSGNTPIPVKSNELNIMLDEAMHNYNASDGQRKQRRKEFIGRQIANPKIAAAWVIRDAINMEMFVKLLHVHKPIWKFEGYQIGLAFAASAISRSTKDAAATFFKSYHPVEWERMSDEGIEINPSEVRPFIEKIKQAFAQWGVQDDLVFSQPNKGKDQAVHYDHKGDEPNDRVDGWGVVCQAKRNKKAHTDNGNTSSYGPLDIAGTSGVSQESRKPQLPSDHLVIPSKNERASYRPLEDDVTRMRGFGLSSLQLNAPREAYAEVFPTTYQRYDQVLTQQNVDVTGREQIMTARTYTTNGAPVNAGVRLRVINTVGMPAIKPTFEYAVTEVYNELEKVKSRVNPNNTTTGGWYNTDLLRFGEESVAGSDYWSYNFMKMWLYIYACFPQYDANNAIPLRTVAQFIRSNWESRKAAVPRVILGWNTSPVFGEDCAVGGFRVMPMTGFQPQLAYHINTVSVPADEQEYIICVPEWIMRSGQYFMANLMLLAMFWLSGPMGFVDWTIAITDIVQGPGTVKGIPFCNQVAWNGIDHNFHFLLPTTRNPCEFPTDQVRANNGPMQRPRNAAGGLQNISFVGNAGLQMVPFLPLFDAYAAPGNVSVQIISIFTNRMAEVLCSYPENATGRLWARNFCARGVPLVVTDMSAGGRFPTDYFANPPENAGDECDSSGFSVTLMEADFPTTPLTTDYVFPSPSLQLYNQIVMGAIKVQRKVVKTKCSISKLEFMMSVACFRRFMMTTQLLFDGIGLSAGSMSLAIDDTDNERLRRFFFCFYLSSYTSGEAINYGRGYKAYDTLMSKFLGTGAPVDMYDRNVMAYRRISTIYQSMYGDDQFQFRLGIYPDYFMQMWMKDKLLDYCEPPPFLVSVKFSCNAPNQLLQGNAPVGVVALVMPRSILLPNVISSKSWFAETDWERVSNQRQACWHNRAQAVHNVGINFEVADASGTSLPNYPNGSNLKVGATQLTSETARPDLPFYMISKLQILPNVDSSTWRWVVQHPAQPADATEFLKSVSGNRVDVFSRLVTISEPTQPVNLLPAGSILPDPFEGLLGEVDDNKEKEKEPPKQKVDQEKVKPKEPDINQEQAGMGGVVVIEDSNKEAK